MKVIVSDPISDEGLNIFYENNIDVIDATNSAIDENYEHIPTANGWVIRSGTTLDANIIKKADKLTVIGRAGVGIDNIEIESCKARGVLVGWTGGVNKRSVSELTLGYMLILMRNIFSSYSNLKKFSSPVSDYSI